MQWITEQETGGVLQPWDQCTKTGDWVTEVLRAKDPEAQTPTAASLDSYPDRLPVLTPVDIIDDTVKAVAGQLSRGAGPVRTDSVSLQHFILRFGAASRELRMIFGQFVEWLGNGRPPWATYRALMSGQLIVPTTKGRAGRQKKGVAETEKGGQVTPVPA